MGGAQFFSNGEPLKGLFQASIKSEIKGQYGYFLAFAPAGGNATMPSLNSPPSFRIFFFLELNNYQPRYYSLVSTDQETPNPAAPTCDHF